MRNSYREFRIKVCPSLNAGEYEVRFLADGEDIISMFGNDVVGLDPDDVLIRPCPLYAATAPHWATVAMCACGVLGCGDVGVEVILRGENVEWAWNDGTSSGTLSFPATTYHAEIERAIDDTSWESPDRTAARLLREKVDREFLARHGMTYSWASARVRKEKFTVSVHLEPGPYQILIHVPWEPSSVEDTVRACSTYLAGDPADWPEVEWYPQQANLDPPMAAGSAWRRGS